MMRHLDCRGLGGVCSAPMLTLALVACDGPDYTSIPQERVVDSFAYVDAGALPPGDRQPFTVPLFSRADGAARIFEVVAEDISVPEGAEQPAFIVDDSYWANELCDSNGDGVADCLDLEGYDPSSDADTFPLNVIFAPTVEGYYEGILTIWSNDTQTTEMLPLPDDPEGDEWGVWRVQLRGLSRYACGFVWPDFHDYGKRAAGGDFPTTFHVQNCGIVTLTVSAITLSETTSMASLTLPPLYVLPGEAEEIDVGWTPAAYTDGEPTPERGVLSFAGNSDLLSAETVEIIGNDCAQSADSTWSYDGTTFSSESTSWDADGDGFTPCGGDCDDTDPNVNPSVSEAVDPELEEPIDDDCDGAFDEAANPIDTDDDGDGCNESGSLCGSQDCNDANAAVYPGATETANGVDDDCDGWADDHTERYDDDNDALSERDGDCDDENPLVLPGAAEILDGVDNDCDGTIDEGGPDIDDDGDGFLDVEVDTTQNDCDDNDPWVFVGAREYCDDYDNDCDGLADEGNETDEGGLDAENGACAFQPARADVASASAAEDTGVGSGGCSAVGAGTAMSAWVTASTALLVRRRRRA